MDGLHVADGELVLAGIPPLAGFTGKWYIFSDAVQKGQVWIVLVAILFSVVSLCYYQQVITRIYIRDSDALPPVPLHFTEGIALLVCIAATVILGLYPEPLMRVGEAAARSPF